jgi:tetratricopeptide (TPR) repeat protein
LWSSRERRARWGSGLRCALLSLARACAQGKSTLALQLVSSPQLTEFDVIVWVAADRIGEDCRRLAERARLPHDSKDAMGEVGRWLTALAGAARTLLVLDNAEGVSPEDMKRVLPTAGVALVVSRRPPSWFKAVRAGAVTVPLRMADAREAHDLLGLSEFASKDVVDGLIEEVCSSPVSLCLLRRLAAQGYPPELLLRDIRQAKVSRLDDADEEDNEVSVGGPDVSVVSPRSEMRALVAGLAATVAVLLRSVSVESEQQVGTVLKVACACATLYGEAIPHSFFFHWSTQNRKKDTLTPAIVTSVMASLVRHGLLSSNADGVARMHRTVQAVVREMDDDNTVLEQMLKVLRVEFGFDLSRPDQTATSKMVPQVAAVVQNCLTVARLSVTEDLWYLMCELARWKSHYGEYQEVRTATACAPTCTVIAADACLPCQALRLFEETSRLTCSVLGSSHPAMLHTLNNIGLVYMSLGQYDRALQHLEMTLSLKQASSGNDHLSVADTQMTIGNVYRVQGQLQYALACYEEALRIKTKALGDSHAALGETLTLMIAAYRELGQQEQALAHLDRLLRVRRATIGEAHPSVAELLIQMGTLHRAMGQLTMAADCFEKAVQIMRKAAGSDHVSLCDPLLHHASVQNELNHHKWALEAYEEALRIKRKALGPDHASLVDIFASCGGVYRNAGMQQRAVDCYQEALRISRRAGNAGATGDLLIRFAVLVERRNGPLAKEMAAEGLQLLTATYGAEHQRVKAAMQSVTRMAANAHGRTCSVM